MERGGKLTLCRNVIQGTNDPEDENGFEHAENRFRPSIHPNAGQVDRQQNDGYHEIENKRRPDGREVPKLHQFGGAEHLHGKDGGVRIPIQTRDDPRGFCVDKVLDVVVDGVGHCPELD